MSWPLREHELRLVAELRQSLSDFDAMGDEVTTLQNGAKLARARPVTDVLNKSWLHAAFRRMLRTE